MHSIMSVWLLRAISSLYILYSRYSAQYKIDDSPIHTDTVLYTCCAFCPQLDLHECMAAKKPIDGGIGMRTAYSTVQYEYTPHFLRTERRERESQPSERLDLTFYSLTLSSPFMKRQREREHPYLVRYLEGPGDPRVDLGRGQVDLVGDEAGPGQLVYPLPLLHLAYHMSA